jgi:hypothetical protein
MRAAFPRRATAQYSGGAMTAADRRDAQRDWNLAKQAEGERCMAANDRTADDIRERLVDGNIRRL